MVEELTHQFRVVTDHSTDRVSSKVFVSICGSKEIEFNVSDIAVSYNGECGDRPELSINLTAIRV